MLSSKGDDMSTNNQQPDSPISALRRRLRMTQEEFAHAIGVTVSTVNRWENGHIEPSRLARKAIEVLAGQALGSSESGSPSVPLFAKAS
jgi:DNA-binding transcriptional regulator YiaG